MEITIKAFDIVDELVNVLIFTENIYLNMPGGVNGEILIKRGRDNSGGSR